jgi:hypothetical protein
MNAFAEEKRSIALVIAIGSSILRDADFDGKIVRASRSSQPLCEQFPRAGEFCVRQTTV